MWPWERDTWIAAGVGFTTAVIMFSLLRYLGAKP